MSIEKAAAEFRQVLDALDVAPLVRALDLIDEAERILAAASQGTQRPEAGQALGLLAQAKHQGAHVYHQVEAARRLIEQYLTHIAGGQRTHGTSRATASPTPSSSRPRSGVDHDLIEEARRQGKKITAEKVVRISRADSGELVWLETGDENAGLVHLHSDKRVAEFERAGITKDEIVEVVFSALVGGTLIGATGHDRLTYEIEHRGRIHRVAVTVGDNGFIVGANPISRNRKVKPLS